MSPFPPGYQTPTRVMTMERILPLTKETRRERVMGLWLLDFGQRKMVESEAVLKKMGDGGEV